MTSKDSRAKPAGSILAWQAAQVAFAAMFVELFRGWYERRGRRARPREHSGAGGSGGLPRSLAMTNAPRGTGEVVVPLAVTLRIAAWVRKPPRGQSGGELYAADLRAADIWDAVVDGQLLVEHREVGFSPGSWHSGSGRSARGNKARVSATIESCKYGLNSG